MAIEPQLALRVVDGCHDPEALVANFQLLCASPAPRSPTQPAPPPLSDLTDHPTVCPGQQVHHPPEPGPVHRRGSRQSLAPWCGLRALRTASGGAAAAAPPCRAATAVGVGLRGAAALGGGHRARAGARAPQ
jgi:hypothetical protein